MSTTPSDTILFGCQIKYDAYKSCDTRLQTFETWPPQMFQDKVTLAQNGFFYTGQCDRVICAFCGVKVERWTTMDIVIKEHKKWSPDCIYLKLTGCQDTNKYPIGHGAF
jgi:hypothetical protein